MAVLVFLPQIQTACGLQSLSRHDMLMEGLEHSPQLPRSCCPVLILRQLPCLLDEEIDVLDLVMVANNSLQVIARMWASLGIH